MQAVPYLAPERWAGLGAPSPCSSCSCPPEPLSGHSLSSPSLSSAFSLPPCLCRAVLPSSSPAGPPAPSPASPRAGTAPPWAPPASGTARGARPAWRPGPRLPSRGPWLHRKGPHPGTGSLQQPPLGAGLSAPAGWLVPTATAPSSSLPQRFLAAHSSSPPPPPCCPAPGLCAPAALPAPAPRWAPPAPRWRGPGAG